MSDVTWITPLQGRSVMFATPSLTHSVSLEFLRSWTQTIINLIDLRVPSFANNRPGDAFVAKARNKLATAFLRHPDQPTDLFFLDDDIGWPPEKVTAFLLSDKDVIAGIYPKKSEQTDYPVQLAYDGDTGELIRDGELYRAMAVPTGFLRIKRPVIEQLAEKAQVFKDIELSGETVEYYGIFETGIGNDGWWWGEDYTFCRKWSDLGGEMWVDPDIAFDHRGNKCWNGTLLDHIDLFQQRAKDRVLGLPGVNNAEAA